MPPVYLKTYDISKTFYSRFLNKKRNCVLEGISLHIKAGKTIGITGCSGAGKTILGKIIAGIEEPTAGEIYYKGKNISMLEKKEHSVFRRKVQMMFQDPQGALNPLKTVKKLIGEVCGLVRIEKEDRENRISSILETVGLSEDILCRYANQLSGGQNQRVVLARILLIEPEVIILDEPTSALDISVQAQILHLLKKLQNEKKLGYLFISHDPDVVRFMCDEIYFIENRSLKCCR